MKDSAKRLLASFVTKLDKRRIGSYRPTAVSKLVSKGHNVVVFANKAGNKQIVVGRIKDQNVISRTPVVVADTDGELPE